MTLIKTVPIDATSRLAAELIPNAQFKVYEGAPHGLFITEMNKLTDDIEEFVKS